MKPYGRDKNLKGTGPWKKNISGLKKGFINWWEDIIPPSSRSAMKRKWKKEIDNEIKN